MKYFRSVGKNHLSANMCVTVCIYVLSVVQHIQSYTIIYNHIQNMHIVV